MGTDKDKEDRNYLLCVADGPEGISIYTDDERGVVEWAGSFPALYIEVAINGAHSRFGPFSLGSIYAQIKQRIRDDES